MIYNIIVLILVALIGYQVGLKRGKKYGVCQECIDDVFIQGFEHGVESVLAEEAYKQMIEEEKATPGITEKKSKAVKKAASKGKTKKSK